MVTHLGLFWNGHHFISDGQSVERFTCKLCGSVTSYAQFMSLGSKIEECPKAPPAYGDPILEIAE